VAVEGEAVVALLPDRQAPLLEEVDRVVDEAAEIEDEVTAPERSVAALSTMVILMPLGVAQRAPSKAEPQQAMPPPTRRRSVSISTISGFSQYEKLQVAFSIVCRLPAIRIWRRW
jgi:hypothetical protein